MGKYWIVDNISKIGIVLRIYILNQEKRRISPLIVGHELMHALDAALGR